VIIPPKLTFLGFGEAGTALASGLIDAGIDDIVAYDILQNNFDNVIELEAKARDVKVHLASNYKNAVIGREIIISTVTCTEAVTVARAVSPHLRAGQIYLDVNSVSPETKAEIGSLVMRSGAFFIEASIMSPIYPKRQAAPMILSGPNAPDIIKRMAPYGMILEDMGPEFGKASATKMFRSIIFKGLEALLQECVVAADHYGVAEKVLDSITHSYPEIGWDKLASYFMERTVTHGTRRAQEMEEVAKTLRALKIEPFMAEGAAKRIAWLADQKIKEALDGKTPKNYREILNALRLQ
tara:strand:+ start:467 stop:1354 length:888 start_codon:yes stop_codon:yes gene_type:complete